MASRRSALNSDESSFGEEEGPRKPRGPAPAARRSRGAQLAIARGMSRRNPCALVGFRVLGHARGRGLSPCAAPPHTIGGQSALGLLYRTERPEGAVNRRASRSEPASCDTPS